MHYTRYSPAPRLMPYIDCYWHVRGQGAAAQQERILPDGCVDIIINIGENFHTDSMVMTYENVYIVGTMTHCKLPFMDGASSRKSLTSLWVLVRESFHLLFVIGMLRKKLKVIPE